MFAGSSLSNSEMHNDGEVDAAARIQIDNRQSKIGSDFALPPLRSNGAMKVGLTNYNFKQQMYPAGYDSAFPIPVS